MIVFIISPERHLQLTFSEYFPFFVYILPFFWKLLYDFCELFVRLCVEELRQEWNCSFVGSVELSTQRHVALFLAGAAPPTREMDASKTKLDSFLVFCNSLCIVFVSVLWCGSRWLVREWVWQTNLIGKINF